MPVKVTITTVVKTPNIATRPCSAGCSTRATACACGVEPMPASFEKRPRATPNCIALATVRPSAPPMTASGSKAATKMSLKAGITSVMWAPITQRPPMR